MLELGWSDSTARVLGHHKTLPQLLRRSGGRKLQGWGWESPSRVGLTKRVDSSVSKDAQFQE